MTLSPSRWQVISPSRFPWEQDAFNFTREGLPDLDPYRVWQGFEFIAEDGSLNEVDLLALTPAGLFLVEVKSRPGVISGDAGTWTWSSSGGTPHTDENPLFAANSKAKKLRSLLDHQRSARRASVRIPFIEPLIFCSSPDQVLKLQGHAASKVCVRDAQASEGAPRVPGVLAALERRECPGLDPRPTVERSREVARVLAAALGEAGIRPTNRSRRLKDYLLEAVLMEGPGFQDWQAVHSRLKDTRRRIRLYLSPPGATAESRQILERAAQRELRLLETLQHPGILRALELTEHDLGPALVLEHDARSLRLDHFLSQSGPRLGNLERLDLLRQVAEAVRYAHGKKVIHRALSPQSILVTPGSRGAGSKPRVKIFNWQVGFRGEASSTGFVPIRATEHVGHLVEDASTAYMSPEALHPAEEPGEYVDVFSLGAVAYFLFSGKPPGANAHELHDRLQGTSGLKLSAVLNAAPNELEDLIRDATHPQVSLRLESAAGFLERLDALEARARSPAEDTVEDPAEAGPGSRLAQGFVVKRRLGTGATSVALLVERSGTEYVLKVASSPEHNDVIAQEGEVLKKLRHQLVVEHFETLEIGGRTCLLMGAVGVETLRDRLRADGPLGVELLERFGEDLLQVVAFLEEQGVPHRDLKPDNLAVGKVGRSSKLHLVLFDFSLSRVPAENIQAGTAGYLEPFLRQRSPRRWDLHAERYAAAVTLYELATGRLPRWGDGQSDPSQLDCEVSLEADLFDASLRDALAELFRKALCRDPAQRFDNAEEMLRAWQRVFHGVRAEARSEAELSPADLEADIETKLEGVRAETPIHELPLGTRARNALDRAHLLNAGQLLRFPQASVLRLRGVGNKTRREISTVVKVLRRRLGIPEAIVVTPEPAAAQAKALDAHAPATAAEGEPVPSGLDGLVRQLLPSAARARDAGPMRVLRAWLGLDASPSDPWPSQTEVAERVGLTRARVNQVVSQAVERWKRLPSVTALRQEVDDALGAHGGVLAAAELRDAILLARGPGDDEPAAPRLALAVARAAIEVERGAEKPSYLLRRTGARAIVARSEGHASYALRLGDEADRVAGEDPLLPPARMIERLAALKAPAGMDPLAEPRLVRLAIAASERAALSSRQEIYPRGLEALRAVRLALGALSGSESLTVDQVRDRVASRYPEAQPLPGRPGLDDLLREAGLELRWEPGAAGGGNGAYLAPAPAGPLVSSGSTRLVRHPTLTGPLPPIDVTPEIAAARQFEERLERALRDCAFIALTVEPRWYLDARREIVGRFPVRDLDLEALFLERLKAAAAEIGVRNWELVLQADASPGTEAWQKLLALVRRAVPRIEEEILASDRTVLLSFPGLLARYEQLDLLERLRDRIGRPGGIPGLWVLLPMYDQDELPVLDGRPVPTIGPAQRARIPASWVENRHRAAPAAQAGAEAAVAAASRDPVPSATVSRGSPPRADVQRPTVQRPAADRTRSSSQPSRGQGGNPS